MQVLRDGASSPPAAPGISGVHPQSIERLRIWLALSHPQRERERERQKQSRLGWGGGWLGQARAVPVPGARQRQHLPLVLVVRETIETITNRAWTANF